MSPEGIHDRSSRAFFEARYQASEDPWSFATSSYELFRYERIVEALTPGWYERAFEPGCSIGVLSQKLAPLCGSLLSTDLSSSAVQRAQWRCRDLRNIIFSTQALEETGSDAWDLLVLSEVGYYFTADRWQTLVQRLIAALQPGATVLGCHWLGRSSDHRIRGDQVHAILDGLPELQRMHSERHADFRLDKWCRR